MSQAKATVDPVAYRSLQLVCVLFPLLSGIDKFFHWIVNWDQYVSPLFLELFGEKVHPILRGLGVMEAIIGIGMIFRPGIFGYLLCIYMLIIVGNLLSTGAFRDIALRDFCIAMSALALARLSRRVRS